ncbi:Gfo/Idh/MocA family oxidoreductase [Paenibacillus aurantius]|uniref:Gfo/Idh/MocA family oxidoreductase n=1 Tax=Paenibacillus aurantius TaxID=2918900 RepID=A0AA96LBK5_9BACL|nr:Gfo/Idh/MocA family oxidoreductase [Paenibacillus aurantius]WNQ10671.1 Gfo/Idh/MocA family oxidoreductase [Paenibacillus aurantius]
MRTFRAGVIGCGSVGKVHTECVKQLDGFDMVAYCDIFEENALSLLEQYGGEYATSDIDRFFADDSLDVIYVTTLHDTHAEYSIRALLSGKHVMVEKPLALTAEECVRVGDAVNQSGKKLMAAFKLRFHEMVLKAKELIPNPVMVSMQLMDNRWGDHIWANDPIKGGGNILSQGCHATDILRFVAGGDPVETYATGGHYYQANGLPDNISAVYRFDNGVAGNLIVGDANTPSYTSKFYMQIFAEGKSVTLSDRLTTLTYNAADEEPVVFRSTEAGMLEENKALLQCLQQETEPPVNHIDGLYSTLMIMQAIESLNSRKPEPIRPLIEQLNCR